MSNQRDRNEKVIRMKLQTAKVLWNEGRRDATFLLLESINDVRADNLREQMGFADEYEVGLPVSTHSFSRLHTIGIALGSAFLFFVLGWFVSPDTTTALLIDTTLDTNAVMATIIATTPAPNNTFAQPLIEQSVTADIRQSTASVFLTEQLTQEALANELATERYDHATATSVAATQTANN